MEAIARQPEASGDIRMNMIIAAALIEGVALLAVVVCLLAVSYTHLCCDTLMLKVLVNEQRVHISVIVYRAKAYNHAFFVFCNHIMLFFEKLIPV